MPHSSRRCEAPQESTYNDGGKYSQDLRFTIVCKYYVKIFEVDVQVIEVGQSFMV